MSSVEQNPFSPVEVWENTQVKVQEDDAKKIVDAKHYHVRFIIGESSDKRFINRGDESVHELSNKTIFVAPSIHRVGSDPFHYDINEVESIVGAQRLQEKSRQLLRAGQCDDHELIEVAYYAPGVECCELTKEEADKRQVPLKYVAGYLLGRSDGFVKVALAKTVLDSGEIYYAHIHIVPESAIKNWSCLE
ncbi:MAG: hypothetical protein ACTSYL_09930 [Candidatus Thorarchaeota archaeon]